MPFIPMDAVQYRSLDAEQFEARRAEVIAELENPDSEVSTDTLTAEVGIIQNEVERRNAVAQVRSASVSAVANGAGAVIASTGGASNVAGTDARVTRNEDPFDTEEYNRAFADYVCRGIEYPDGLVQPGQRPANVRDDAFTYTTDVQHFIPTTLSSRIIEKMEIYGELWPEVTKMNVRGGLDINIWDWLPTASWVTESTTADYQKTTDATPISFKYYMAEVRVAQSFLAAATTLEEFQRRYAAKCAEALVRLLDAGIMNGTGSGQMLGILKDTRITGDHKVSVNEEKISTWAGWANILKPLTRPYRNGVFIMAQDTWDKYIDGMVDANGQPVARVNYGLDGANNEQYRFMGKRVKIVEDSLLPSFDDASNANPFMVFTRLSDYLVNQQTGMRSVRWLDEDANLIKNKAQIIVDGKPGDVNGTLIFNKQTA